MKTVIASLVLVLSMLGPSSMPVDAQTVDPGAKGYLIGSKAPLTQSEVLQLEKAGARLTYVYQNFGGASAVIPASSVAAVSALPFVTSLGEDTLKQLHEVSGLAMPAGISSLPSTPYWLDLMDAENNNSYDGSGVWVAVLDSGFYPNWRDYFDESSVLTELAKAFITNSGRANESQWEMGSDPHGMATAATIVGYRYRDLPKEGGWGTGYATGGEGTYWVPGMAPGAKVIPIKVCEPIGCWTSATNAGIDYVTGLKKANPTQPIVINMSIGGPALEPTEKAAIDASVKAGVIMVVSAGNEGTEGMSFPAAYEPVISVGAGGWTQQWNNYPDKTWWLDEIVETGVDEVYIPSFSSREHAGQYLDLISAGRYLLLPYPCAQLYKDGQVTSATENRMCAAKATPDSVRSAPFQYLFMSGTSFSAPATAGVVALMLQKDPALSNADAAIGTIGNPASWGSGYVERLLEGSATQIDPGSETVIHRTGDPLTESWEADATGHGWIFVDDALAAVP